MGAPCGNLRTLITRLSKQIDKVALSNSALFIVPSLATTLASFILFYLLGGFDAGKLNTLAVILMSSVILSLITTACIQFVVYRVAGEASLSKERLTARSRVNRAIILGVISSVVFSIIVSGLSYPYFNYVLGFSTAQFSYFAILLVLYSIIWILTAAFWASAQYKYPALIYTISYCAVFILSYLLYRLNPGYTIYGYIAGIAILLALLSLASWSVFRGGQKPQKLKLLEAPLTIPKLISKEYWGMLFQTFYIIAIFLDKIIVWVSEGAKAGNGLQFIGPYTTGAFLGLVPTFSVVALAHFTEKIKPLSKDLYQGTLSEMRARIDGYKRLYRKGLLVMLTIGLILLISVIGFSAYFIGDTQVLMVALTIATGVLFFEVILYDSFVLPIFGKSYISVVSIMAVCFGEALAVPFVSNDIWYAAVGFLAGSFVGFLISHSQATRLLSEFDYNAFRAFQASN
jgi:uncharacterized membrane protein